MDQPFDGTPNPTARRLLLGAALSLTVLASACGDDDEPAGGGTTTPATDTSTTGSASTTSVVRVPDTPGTSFDELTISTVDDPRFGLTIEHPLPFELEDIDNSLYGEVVDRNGDVCDVPRLRLGRGLDALEIETVPTDCEVDNGEPGNGDHGAYRTFDDVFGGRPSSVETVDLSVGTAEVFTQDYYECTNECTDFTDRVAIVTLDQPSDPKHPTVVFRANKSELPEWVFDQILGDLRMS